MRAAIAPSIRRGFWFEGWGHWFPSDLYDYDAEQPHLTGKPEIYIGPQGRIIRTSSPFEHGCPCDVPPGYVSMVKVGKRVAGRLLDGREWNEFPESDPCPRREAQS